MFVYQNSNRDICVTFVSNRPVENPEYVISIDHVAGTITVNGEVMEAASKDAEEDDQPETESDPVVEETVVEEEDSTEPVEEDELETEEE